MGTWKIKHMKVHLYMRTSFLFFIFHYEGVQTPAQVIQPGCEVSLEYLGEPQRYPNPDWIQPWATCCSQPCSSRGIGPNGPKRSPPDWPFLCDSVTLGAISLANSDISYNGHTTNKFFSFLLHVLNSFHKSLHNQPFYTQFDALHKAGKSSCFGNWYWQRIFSNQLCKSILMKVHKHALRNSEKEPSLSSFWSQHEMHTVNINWLLSGIFAWLTTYLH